VACDLSIIFGTYNRLESLKRCLSSIYAAVDADIDYEIVVVDGGSTDGSLEYLRGQDTTLGRLHPVSKLLVEERREGAVRAFNRAFEASEGRYVMALNDDVEVLGDALSSAFRILEKRVVGQLALAYREGKQTNAEFRTYPVHRRPYANLGMIRRDVAEKIAYIQGGFWNPIYHTYAADTELSCWVWKLGYTVEPALESRCLDWCVQDGLRETNNNGRNREDSALFYSRWPRDEYLLPGGPYPNVMLEELERFEQVVRGDWP